jgi:hypothetical protein
MQYHIVFLHTGMNPIFAIAVHRLSDYVQKCLKMSACSRNMWPLLQIAYIYMFC